MQDLFPARLQKTAFRATIRKKREAKPVRYLILYLILISLPGVFLTLFDKAAAKRGARRVPEAVLMGVGALGGAFAEFLAMRIVRHKTQHAKFMLGLPLLIIAHAGLLYYLLFVLRLFGEF